MSLAVSLCADSGVEWESPGVGKPEGKFARAEWSTGQPTGGSTGNAGRQCAGTTGGRQLCNSCLSTASCTQFLWDMFGIDKNIDDQHTSHASTTSSTSADYIPTPLSILQVAAAHKTELETVQAKAATLQTELKNTASSNADIFKVCGSVVITICPAVQCSNFFEMLCPPFAQSVLQASISHRA